MNLIYFIIALFYISAFASGGQNYPSQQKYQSKPKFSGPRALSSSSFKAKINYARSNYKISIHESSANENSYYIKGSYSNPQDFEGFLEKIKNSLKDPNSLSIKKSKSSFAGRVNYDFEINGTNLWK